MILSNLKVLLNKYQLEEIDCLGIIIVILFSTRTCIELLCPWIPYISLGNLLFIIYILVLFKNRELININAIKFIGVFYSIVIFFYLITDAKQNFYIVNCFLGIKQFTQLFCYFIVFSQIKSPGKWLSVLTAIAYINLILLMITVFSGAYISVGRPINYIGLGITALMWIPIIIQNAICSEGKNSIFHFTSVLLFTLFLTFYGNRGSVVALSVYYLYCVYQYTGLKTKLKIITITGIVLLTIYFFRKSLSLLALELVSNLGITSRNLVLLLKGQIGYTTHRFDSIWVKNIQAIESEWLWGNGLCYDRVIGGSAGVYAHNLFLEVWVSFGIILGTALLILHFYVGYKVIFKSGYMWNRLGASFFITSTVLLMFNSSFCSASIFYIPYAVYFAFLNSESRGITS